MNSLIEETNLHKVLTSFGSKFSTLRSREELLSSEITAQLPYHPLAELVVKLPRNQLRLCVLWVVHKELPFCVRCRLEEIFRPDKCWSYSDTILSLMDDLKSPRWVSGRLPEVLERALGETQMYVRLKPRPAKRKVRRRGYRESCVTSIEERPQLAARKKANAPEFGELPKKQQIRELQISEIRRADEILACEALGIQAPTAHESAVRRDYDLEKFGIAFHPLEQEDPCPPLEMESREEEPEVDVESELCKGCQFSPRGSFLCAAGSLSCDGGRKPILND
jgi:hypothetical protein